jgi:ribosomal-protein-alanine N-acetyltransferase
MTEIFMREMHETDIPEVLEIENMSFSTPWSKTAFINEILKQYSLTKVAILGDKIIGYICVNHITDEGHILNLAVHPHFRRQGVAKTLVEKVLKELRENSCKYIYLEVRVSNFGARKFYGHLGFKVMGMRKNYYILPTEDGIVMAYGL